MLHERWRFRIKHILDAIEYIESFTAGMSFEEFRQDRKTLYAVVFAFAVIGEAASHIPQEVRTKHPEVPWSTMRRMRNLIVHEYERVDEEIVWRTVQDDIKPLVPLLRKLTDPSAPF